MDCSLCGLVSVIVSIPSSILFLRQIYLSVCIFHILARPHVEFFSLKFPD